MKSNLKELAKQKEALKEAIPNSGKLSSPLKKLVRWIEEIETDLEMSGESIVELDMSRLEAIEERDKFLAFIKYNDDL
jgi:hypothetical protein